MQLEELKVYQLSMKIGNDCWNIVYPWNYFEKETIGKQLVKAADSIAANISEGFGRFHYKENQHFGYIARGSLFESKTWIDKSAQRDLIELNLYESLKSEMNELGKMLNNYINKIGNSPKVSEPIESYLTNSSGIDEKLAFFHVGFELPEEWLPYPQSPLTDD
jgi:four helix bundle protein